MALNLSELQQKLDQLIYSLSQMRQKAWKLFYSPTPENVEIQQYDEQGNLVTYSIPNRAKFQEWVWSDARNALQKTIYVDTINGSDSIGTGSQSSPFRTLKKAITSMPSGSIIIVYLSGEDVLTSDVWIENKQVIIFGGGISTSKYQPETGRTGIYCFRLCNSYMQLNDVNITIPERLSNEVQASAPYIGLFCLQRGGGVRIHCVDTVQNKINIHSFYLVSSPTVGFGFVDLNLANATPKLRVNPQKAGILKLTTNTVAFQCPERAGTIKDFYGNNLNIRNLLHGVIFDSKKNPINLLTNLKF